MSRQNMGLFAIVVVIGFVFSARALGSPDDQATAHRQVIIDRGGPASVGIIRAQGIGLRRVDTDRAPRGDRADRRAPWSACLGVRTRVPYAVARFVSWVRNEVHPAHHPRFGHDRKEQVRQKPPERCNEPGTGGNGPYAPEINFVRRNITILVETVPLYYRTGRGPQVNLFMRYISNAIRSGSLGSKWIFYYDSYYSKLPNNDVTIYCCDGDELTFDENGGAYLPPYACKDSLVKNQDNSYTLNEYYSGYKYTYGAASQKLEKVEDPWGKQLTISRDAGYGYRITGITDANSRSTSFYYDASSLVTKIVDPLGTEAMFSYSDTGKLTKIRDCAETETSLLYDAGGYVTSRTTANSTDTLDYVLPDGDPDGNWQRSCVVHSGPSGENYCIEWTGDEKSSYASIHTGTGDKDNGCTDVRRAYVPGDNATFGCVGRGDMGSDGAQQFIKYERNNSGFLTRIGVRREASYFATWYYAEYLLDGSNCRTKTSLPDGREFTYDYNANQNCTRKTYPTGVTADFWYDSNYILTKIKHTDDSTEEFSYDADGLMTKYVDRAAQTYTYDYDTYGYLTKAVSPGSRAWSYANDSAGRLTQITDALSASTSYAYDGYFRLTKVTYADSSYDSYLYTPYALTKHTDRGGRSTAYYCKPNGLVTKLTDAEGRNEEYAYNKLDYRTKVADALGRVTGYSYDIKDGRLTAIAYPNGILHVNYYYDALGNVTKMTDIYGNDTVYNYTYSDRLTRITHPTRTVTYSYDSYNRVTKKATTSLGDTCYSYDTNGRLTKYTDPRGADATYTYDGLSRLTRFMHPMGGNYSVYYDELGNVTKATDLAGGDMVISYDAVERVTKAANPIGNYGVLYYSNVGLLTKAVDPENGETAYAYDGSTWLTKITDPAGVSLSCFLDNTGRQTKLAYALTTFATLDYDAVGNLTKVTAPTSKTVSFYFSNMNELTKCTDGNGNSTAYKYSYTTGLLTKVTKPNGKFTDLERDDYGRLTRWRQYLKDGDPGCFDLWSHEQWFTHDAQSQVTKKSDFYESGHYETGKWTGHVLLTRATAYDYDNTARLTKVTYPGSVTATFYYDMLGKRTRATASNVDLTYTYDEASRLTRVAYDYDSGALTKSVSYYYDTADRTTKMVDGEGIDVAYSYDGAGALTLLTEAGNSRGSYYYNAGGKRTKLTLGNGSYVEYLYDSAGRLTLVCNNKSDDTDISKFAYLLDAAGMRTKMDITGSAYTTAAVGYLYDGAYQLTKETRTGGNSYTQKFWYDSAGNRTKKDINGTPTTYEYDYINRMTKAGSTEYSWDAWANVTKVGTDNEYYWDAANRLTKYDGSGTADDTEYSYMPASPKRFKRSRNGTGTYWLWDLGKLRAEYTSAGTLSQKFTGSSQSESLLTCISANAYYYLHDRATNVQNVVDSSEGTQNIYDYDFFGVGVGTETTAVANPFRSGNEYYDSWEGSLYYWVMRGYYSPSLAMAYSGISNHAHGSAPLYSDVLGDQKDYGQAWCDIGEKKQMVYKVYKDYPFGAGCVTKHEVKHVEDTNPCCKLYNKCLTDKKGDCKAAWDKWVGFVTEGYEADAYVVSYDCAKKCWNDNCDAAWQAGKQTSNDCCIVWTWGDRDEQKMRWYAELSRKKYGPNPRTPDCIFNEDGSIKDIPVEDLIK